MPRIYLAGASALAFWLSPKAMMFDRGFVEELLINGENPANYMAYLKGPMGFPAPISLDGENERIAASEAQALRRYLGTWPPFHTAVSGSKPQCTTHQIEHLHPAAVPRNSYLALSSQLAVATPELTLLQCISELDDLEGLVLCCLFCSIFCFDGSAQQGQRPRRMLTSRERIEGFLLACGNGVKPPSGAKRLRKMLSIVVEQAASPAELELALRMRLPQRKGGYGFGKILLNYEVKTHGNKRYCDFYFPKANLGVEYHSDADHGSVAQWKNDAARSNELLGSRISEFVLTSRELMSVECMDRAASHIAHRMNGRQPEHTTREQRIQLSATIRSALSHFKAAS